MKKKVYHITFSAILIAITIGTVFVLSKEYNKPISNENNIVKEEPDADNNSNLVLKPPVEKWETYSDSKLGFSIKYPTMVYGLYDCAERKNIWIPLKIINDKDNEITYITQEYSYKANWNSEQDKFDGPCRKITYSLEYLQNEKKEFQKEQFYLWWKPFLGWAISTRNIKNESELDKFIKDNYGSECSVKSKTSWNQNGVYEINIQAENSKEEGINPNCPLNYAYKVLYSPEKNKVISIDLGQECTFGTNPNEKSYKCYDENMINSFKFE